jgi:hypothetical protein
VGLTREKWIYFVGDSWTETVIMTEEVVTSTAASITYERPLPLKWQWSVSQLEPPQGNDTYLCKT